MFSVYCAVSSAMSDEVEDVKMWCDIALVMAPIGSIDIEIEAARANVRAIRQPSEQVKTTQRCHSFSFHGQTQTLRRAHARTKYI